MFTFEAGEPVTSVGSVLVIEDDEAIRESVVEFLTDEGYAATGAIHGRDALDKLANATPPPRLILLDLMMPVMDGRAFRRAQLGNPALAGIPVIVVSALVDSGEQSDELNVSGTLKKPFTLVELLGYVRRYCGVGAAGPYS